MAWQPVKPHVPRQDFQKPAWLHLPRHDMGRILYFTPVVSNHAGDPTHTQSLAQPTVRASETTAVPPVLSKKGTCASHVSNDKISAMKIPPEPIGVMLAVERLADIFDAPELIEDARRDAFTSDGREWDCVITIRGHTFVLEWKRSGSLSHLAGAIHQAGMVQGSFALVQSSVPRDVTQLLIVPYMGKAAQEQCALAQLCWLDLSGNARIVVPGIFHQNLGNPTASVDEAGRRAHSDQGVLG